MEDIILMTILSVFIFPVAVVLLTFALAMFVLFLDAVAFAITDFISRYSNSRSKTKED